MNASGCNGYLQCSCKIFWRYLRDTEAHYIGVRLAYMVQLLHLI